MKMSGKGSKRTTVTGSSASLQASAKRPKGSAEGSETDQQDASWSTVMTPELIGTVARYLDLGTPSRPDLANLCLVVGRDTSRIVRKVYLAGNEWYLSHLYRVAYERKKHRKQDGMESWLQYNPDWRNRCVGAKSEKNVYSIALAPTVVQDLHFKRLGFNWLLADSSACSDALEEIPSGLAFGIGDALLSVGGFDVTGMKKDDFYNLLKSVKVTQEGKIALKYLPASILLFSDPLVAAKYDFLAPFKFLIETGAVGVNEAFVSTKISNDEKENLIWFTVGPNNISSTCTCFEYLLSVEGIDVNTEDVGEDRLIRHCSDSNDVFSLEALRLLVDSRNLTSLDLHVRDRVAGWTVIHCVTSAFSRNDHKTKMSKLKLLLEAGAHPNLPDDFEETPESYLLETLNLYKNKGKESEEEESEIYEIVGMLRCYTLRRR